MEETINILCLGSGSTGNCYVFQKHNEVVLVECGLEYPILCQKLMEHSILPSQIKSVICTHAHKDHTLAVPDLFRHGVKLHLPQNIDRSGDVVDKAKIKITSWLTAYCFKVNHDVEAYGFAFLDTENKQSYLFRY